MAELLQFHNGLWGFRFAHLLRIREGGHCATKDCSKEHDTDPPVVCHKAKATVTPIRISSRRLVESLAAKMIGSSSILPRWALSHK